MGGSPKRRKRQPNVEKKINRPGELKIKINKFITGTTKTEVREDEKKPTDT